MDIPLILALAIAPALYFGFLIRCYIETKRTRDPIFWIVLGISVPSILLGALGG